MMFVQEDCGARGRASAKYPAGVVSRHLSRYLFFHLDVKFTKVNFQEWLIVGSMKLQPHTVCCSACLSLSEELKLTIRRVAAGAIGLESRPIAPHLPTELLLLIFSHLAPRERYSKKPNIRSCRLVCHHWANAAVEVLFHDIHVNAGAFSEHPSSNPSEELLKTSFPIFLEKNTSIGHHVRYLRIYFDEEPGESPIRDPHSQMSAGVIKHLLQLIPRLEGLALHRVLFSDPEQLATSEDSDWRPTSLRSLAIDFGLRFIMPIDRGFEPLSCNQELSNIFGWFIDVHDLTLAGYNHTNHDIVLNPENVGRFPPSLQSLTLRSSYLHGNLLDSIVTSTSEGSLQSLFISLFSDMDRTLQYELDQFLVTVGPRLTSLGCGAERKPIYTEQDVLQAYFDCT